MAISYGLTNAFLATKPKTVEEFTNERQDRRMKQAEAAQNQQLNAMKMQDAQDGLAANRRLRAVSVLSGLSGVQDPEKRRQLYPSWAEAARRTDPTLDLPDEYDEDYLGALTAGTVSPEKKIELDILRDKADESALYRQALLQDKMAQRNNNPLPEAATKRIESASTTLTTLDRLNSGFKDEFGGNAAGGLENLAGRFGGENVGLADEGQTQWWQDYQGFKNEVRNELFGSALTATEKAEFDKAMISPGMDPKQIRANLARQQDAAARAAAKLSAYYKANGYRSEPIDVMLPQQPAGQTPPANLPLEQMSDDDLLRALGAM